MIDDTDSDGTCVDSEGCQTTYLPKARKRMSIDSPKVTKKQQRMSEGSNNSNRFSVLDLDVQSNKHNSTEKEDSMLNAVVSHKPPPIFVPQVSDINKMLKSFSIVIGKENFTYKSGRDGQARVMTSNSDCYRKLVSYLDTNNITFHTYQLKEDKPYRIVIKNIHFSTPIDDIKHDLAKNGHTVRNIVNAKSKISKLPMSIFFVDLEPSTNNKKVFDVNRLYNAVVKIEPPRKFNELVQCHRCQEFGHTKQYCKKPYRCVKCALDHPSSLCSKDRETPPKCFHCLQNHTANYKGCKIYQELVSKKDALNNKTRPSLVKFTNAEQQVPHRNVSYADVTRGQLSSTTSTVRHEKIDKLEELIAKQIELTTTLINMMSSLFTKLCN